MTAPPSIPPVPTGVERPFWSVMVPTYNDGDYLAEALDSLRAQLQPAARMQVEVVDDCSTEGDPEAVVRRVLGERATLWRNESNQGVAGNWNVCASRARGEWVHFLHADDVLLPGFYQRYEQLLALRPELVMLCAQAEIIDDAGQRTGDRLPPSEIWRPDRAANPTVAWARGNGIAPATVALRRDVFERVGGFRPELRHTPDWEMWARASTLGPVGFVDTTGLLVRMHRRSATSQHAATDRLMRDSLAALTLILDLLPREQRAACRRVARRNFALAANQWHYEYHRQGRADLAWRQACWAARLEPSVANLARLCRAGGRALIARPRPAERS